MKKAILYITLTILIACSGCMFEYTRDVIGFFRDNSIGMYSWKRVDYETVGRDVVYMMRFYDRRWKASDVKTVTEILMFAHNHKDFRIDYRVALGIMAHESNMKIGVRAYNLGSGTIDYGLTQQNSRYVNKRIRSAIRLNKRYHILPEQYVRNDKYDPAANTIAMIIYLRDNRKMLEEYSRKSNKRVSFKKWVISYNAGFGGTVENIDDDEYRNMYYKRVIKNIAWSNWKRKQTR